MLRACDLPARPRGFRVPMKVTEGTYEAFFATGYTTAHIEAVDHRAERRPPGVEAWGADGARRAFVTLDLDTSVRTEVAGRVRVHRVFASDVYKARSLALSLLRREGGWGRLVPRKAADLGRRCSQARVEGVLEDPPVPSGRRRT